MNRLVTIAAALVSLTASHAHAEDCAVKADELRVHLTEASGPISTWNTAWTIGFGAAAAGSFALVLAKWNPFGAYDANFKETMIVGGVKASFGFSSRLTVPLRVHLPSADADRCVELAALRKEAKEIRKKEHGVFWLTVVGGTALNLAGGAALWYRRSFSVGAVSFAIGFPVGLANAFTLPRSTWRLVDEESASWSAAVVPTEGGAMAVVGSAF